MDKNKCTFGAPGPLLTGTNELIDYYFIRFLFLSQCDAWGIRAALPWESEQPQYGATQFLFLCAVFSCFRNPPNSDMDYRIFNVHTFLCVRIHSGVGNTDESAQRFDRKKLSQICLVLRAGLEPLVMESIGSRGRCCTK